mgnify:CR=1 FL=1
MHAQANLRTERVAARVTPEQKRLLQRAAELTGRSLTDFILSSAQEAAEETLRTHQVIELSGRDAEVIMSALLNPPRPNDRMKAAARQYRELVTRE